MKHPVAKHECLACGYTDYRMSNRPMDDLVLEACPRCDGDMIISSKDELPEKLEKVANSIDEYFHVWDFQMSTENMKFIVENETPKKPFSELLEKLKKIGYTARIEKENDEINLLIQESPEIEKSNIWINIVLLIATIGTTFGVAGYWYLYPGNVIKAALFSSSLLTILGAHELGHKIQTWRNNVKASWPYFLPIPHPLIGTFGAVIKNKSPIPSKEGLAEIGATGPLLGFVFAIPITIIGLNFSQPFGGELFQQLPTPLIYTIIGKITFGEFPLSLNPHPLAWAGFIGIFVTWLNLLPTGQLDGGHIARSLLSKEKHYLLTRGIGLSLLAFSFFWPGFLILSLLILFVVGKPHPGALDDVSDLNKNGKMMALAGWLVFALSLPIPLWVL